ncbi:hypothetical protein QYS48_05265 [Marivirga arenosa]|uniref:DUF5004 domain-containing protein n=1 Tax=Marivirga arenosa TaxID=3059076 RepID=A0AA49JDP6_9BACT|nr:hypothetical protein [Marivirga sp. ABR2-2]WKK86375.2 hypothetical protein QYS48_05265 [Marivirga sp. ABR2-2]
MKLIYTGLSFLAIGLLLMACNSEEPLTPIEEAQQELLEAIQGTWTANEVRKDGTLITDFEDFTLTISDKSYTTTNGSPVWPGSGSFDFSSVETENEFIRQDGRLFTVSQSGSAYLVTIIYQEQNARGEFGTFEFVIE